MEAHPIPQNVTSFEFHLIGDMTLKQFGYLAAGAGSAYLVFVVFAMNYPVISWPLIILFAGAGFAFAFLPIRSRPLDYWLSSFLKAVYSPTKRVWERNGQTADQDPLFKSRLLMYIPSLTPQSTPPLIKPAPTPKPPPSPTSAQAPQPLPSTQQLDKTVELAREAQGLQVKIIQAERQLTQLRSQPTQSQQGTTNYTLQVNTILENLQKLLNQASQIKQQLETVQQPTGQATTAVPEPLEKSRVKIKVALPSKPKLTQLALTSFPNVINGIINDQAGNYLEAVVVVIYDKEGMPVRALKTNKLGQFSGSTPLPNGTYTIEAEKEGHSFDVLQIELEGQVLPPIMITAK